MEGLVKDSNEVLGKVFEALAKLDPSKIVNGLAKFAEKSDDLEAAGRLPGIGRYTAGAIVSIVEGATSVPTPLLQTAAAPSASTPIVTGVVNIQASVTIQVALSQ